MTVPELGARVIENLEGGSRIVDFRSKIGQVAEDTGSHALPLGCWRELERRCWLSEKSWESDRGLAVGLDVSERLLGTST